MAEENSSPRSIEDNQNEVNHLIVLPHEKNHAIVVEKIPNLGKETVDDGLNSFFTRFGTISRLMTSSSRTSEFVQGVIIFEDLQSVPRAVTANNCDFLGTNIVVYTLSPGVESHFAIQSSQFFGSLLGAGLYYGEKGIGRIKEVDDKYQISSSVTQKLQAFNKDHRVLEQLSNTTSRVSELDATYQVSTRAINLYDNASKSASELGQKLMQNSMVETGVKEIGKAWKNACEWTQVTYNEALIAREGKTAPISSIH